MPAVIETVFRLFHHDHDMHAVAAEDHVTRLYVVQREALLNRIPQGLQKSPQSSGGLPCIGIGLPLLGRFNPAREQALEHEIGAVPDIRQVLVLRIPVGPAPDHGIGDRVLGTVSCIFRFLHVLRASRKDAENQGKHQKNHQCFLH